MQNTGMYFGKMLAHMQVGAINAPRLYFLFRPFWVILGQVMIEVRPFWSKNGLFWAK
jgi:hypothetical protein